MIYQHEAIYALYPDVVKIDATAAYDKNDEVVEYDQSAVDEKAVELAAEAEAKKQAAIDARQSALNKLMALGLTEEESLALGVK